MTGWTGRENRICSSCFCFFEPDLFLIINTRYEKPYAAAFMFF